MVVADLRSFSAAGERLGLTAQAISQLIAELESTLGFKLFDRTTRRVDLTSAGRDYLPAAQTVLRHVQAAETAADDLRHRAAGLVRVGAPLVLACTAVPAAIRAYAEHRPKVVVRIRDVPVEALEDRVAAGDVDIAVGPDRPVGPDVDFMPLFDSPWVLWCAADHPLVGQAEVRWRDLRQLPLVAAGRDHEHSVALMRLSAPEDQRVSPVDVVDNISTALGIAAQGLAATLAPAYVGVIARDFGLKMKRVLEPEIVRKVCVYRPRLRTLSPAAEGFAEHLADWMSRWPEGSGGAMRSGA